ncbi:hypothetical protein CWB66_09460 [Pseudoalteromonas sp. S558]|nr:hypothetical protein CWB66_09460 [Pseudoalteromonas sp. S558]
MLNQWIKLTVYCTHGELHISNILAENAIYPFVVGRKAWLFVSTTTARCPRQRGVLQYCRKRKT